MQPRPSLYSLSRSRLLAPPRRRIRIGEARARVGSRIGKRSDVTAGCRLEGQSSRRGRLAKLFYSH
jgi:hypothetical protein